MRTYLCGFLEDFQYPRDAADVLLDAYDRIDANAEARELWTQAIALYEADRYCNYEDAVGLADRAADLGGIHEYTAELLLFICLSKHLRTLYETHGLPLSYYRRSMEDLRYKLDECRLVYGIVGTFVAMWFKGFFCLERFGMGRLQFEIRTLGVAYQKNGIALSPESKVINVHIPRSGEPLTEEACREAYRLAKAFYKDEIPTDPCPFICHSWLLYPELEGLLKKTSNTYRFLKSFEILKVEPDRSRRDLWRLFDTMEQNPDRLPTDTSMRRAIVEHLKRGGSLGEGLGILFV